MIVTKLKPYKNIISGLKKKDKIGILSCNSCARLCHTGGEKEMKKLSEKLKKQGYNVVDNDLVGVPCFLNQLKKVDYQGDVTIVLACDAGIYNLKKIFPGKHRIIAGLDSIGLGAMGKRKVEIVRRFR